MQITSDFRRHGARGSSYGALATWLLPLLCSALMASVAAALPASTVLFEGVLTANDGPAADGDYPLTFSVYADAKAVDALWSEGPVTVAVSGGRFVHALGSVKSLPIGAIAAAAAPVLGVTVDKEPELPRVALFGVLYAHVAGGLACTGCVGVAQLVFDGDIDLAGNSIKAKNGTFSDSLTAKSVAATDIAATTVTAAGFVGDGSKLTGLALPKGACKNGEAVVGIAADGALLCDAVVAALPKDGLDDVSNGLLSNQFVDEIFAPGGKLAIPDNTGATAASNIEFPDIGIAEALDIIVHVENTDLSTLSMVLLPPDDKKTGMVLCDPCGGVDAKIFKTTFNDKTKPKSGDIAKYIGTNAKGLWTLKVTDTFFCVPQKVGNAPYCDAANGTDGWIASWSIKVQTLSNQKVAATGALIVTNGLQLSVLKQAPVVCNPSTRGYLYIDDATDGVRICRKTGLWGTFVIHECGNGTVETGETCDDKNTKAGDGCDATCGLECGNGTLDAGEECDPADAQTKLNCTAECKKIAYGKLWLESDAYQWYPVYYPHGQYKESLAVATCKSVGLRLWRDESGPKDDPNWAYDYDSSHNLGGHDICYKVNSATQNDPNQAHTGVWQLLGKGWTDDIKLIGKANDGQKVTILNHIAHTGSDENNASYCEVVPNGNSTSWAGQANGQPNSPQSIVLCAKGKK